ncbi:MAG: hypothetical protein U9R54_04980 [Bacteroidota bacterium]|nr:hypothetical protein [Bacteroidota bacterium]
MNKQAEIKKLLDKYYNGKSSKEEEIILSDFFCNKEVPEELFPDKELFLFLKTQKDKTSDDIPDLSNKIWENIKSHEKKKKITLKRNFSILSGVAAGIVVIIFSYFMLNNNKIIPNKNYTFNDTYSDPELAYKETKQALLYISKKFNKGTKQLEAIEIFNDGIKQLEPINQYNKATKYIK